MESLPQLFLNFHILHHYKLDINSNVQIWSITGSLLSILYNFSLRYAYVENNQKIPTKKEIIISTLKNCIPLTNIILSMFVGLSINRKLGYIFLSMIGIPIVLPILMYVSMNLLHIFGYIYACCCCLAQENLIDNIFGCACVNGRCLFKCKCMEPFESRKKLFDR